MKCKAKVSFLLTSLMLVFSCDFDTHVINTVHQDGSVTRKVIMKGGKDSVFDPELYRIPLDSTWNIEESFEVGENNDTTWILTAEKWFPSVEEINRGYETDLGINSLLERSAHFKRNFRWFTTVYRFSERVESILDIEVPASEFLNREQMQFFYLPGQARQNLLGGTDSTVYKEMEEHVDSLTEIWMWTAFVRQWIDLFYERSGDDPDLVITREEMMARDSLFIRQLIEEDSRGGDGNSNDVAMADTLTGQEEDDLAAVIIPVLGSDFFMKFGADIDSAGAALETLLEPYFGMGDYDMEIGMPGRIVASNGFAVTESAPEEAGNMLWTVSGDYFISQPYEMWVESQVRNYWAWVVTAVFILFVITGLLFRSSRRKKL